MHVHHSIHCATDPFAKLGRVPAARQVIFDKSLLGNPVLCRDSDTDLVLMSLHVLNSMGIHVRDKESFLNNLELQLYVRQSEGEWSSQGGKENWVARWLDSLRYMLHHGGDPIEYGWLKRLINSGDYLHHHFAYLSLSANGSKRRPPRPDADLVADFLKAIETNPRFIEFKKPSYWYGLQPDESPVATICRDTGDVEVARVLVGYLRQDFMGMHAISALKVMMPQPSAGILLQAFLSHSFPAKTRLIDGRRLYEVDWKNDNFMEELGKLIVANTECFKEPFLRRIAIAGFQTLSDSIDKGAVTSDRSGFWEIPVYSDILKLSVLIEILQREPAIVDGLAKLSNLGISCATRALS